ncbi:MAG TPA: NAD(P)-dependent oxidoreductase [Solirubrobacteraceae bacterium]|jgi:2-hydroxy-3-oxopropionate reductase|nr:NAD(P)-dependent oxidoreductase [Solirubrobacteraceae bacterium]
MKVALLGTGRMGAPMGRCMIAAGHELTAWNRTPERALPLAAAGAKLADTPHQAVAGADAVILMLLNGPAVTEVLFGAQVAQALAPGRLVIDMSSIPPALALEHARALEELGHAPLDAPVSGGTQGAAEGTLAIMAGGRAEDFARAQPLLRAMGEPTHVGPAGSGEIAKCVNQLIVAVTIGAVAEGLVLARRAGADPAAVRQALLGGFADSRILQEHGERMLGRAFTPGGTVSGQLKDLRAVAELAAENDLELPLARCVTELYAALAETEHAELDHSALLLEIERRNAGKPLLVEGEKWT